jgi:polysaccharide export outer membrane protein
MLIAKLLSFVVVISLASLSGCANPVAHIPDFPMAELTRGKGIYGSGTEARYQLIPYDQISIRFTYQPEYDTKVPIAIRPDGSITLDSIGSIQAAGLSPEELGALITQKVSERMRDPQVVVSIVQYAPRRIFVGGEVKTPGSVEIREGMTPVQAIFDRGGFTNTAQKDGVVIIRNAGSSNPIIGKIDLNMALESGLPEPITLLANDVIYVPMSGIGRVNEWVKQHLRDIIPSELLSLRPYGF